MNELSLVELSTQYAKLEYKLLESQGEITPEIENELANFEAKLPQKVDAYDFIINKIQANQAMLKSMADKYNAAARTLTNFEDSLKDRIKLAMINLDRTELLGHSTRFKLIKSKPKLVIDESKLSDDYMKTTVQKVPDKDLIRDALDSGQTIQGAKLEEVHYVRSFPNTK